MIRKIILCIGLFLISLPGYAQLWEVGGWLGTASYWGDLKTKFSLANPGPAGGVNVKYNFSSFLGARAEISGGQIAYSDKFPDERPYQTIRNLDFSSPVVDASLLIEFNFFPFIMSNRKYSFSPYIFTGVSTFYFRPSPLGSSTPLRRMGTEGQTLQGSDKNKYSFLSYSVPFGLGVKYAFTRAWSVGIMITNHNTFTDYLDDVSGRYPDKAKLQEAKGEDAVLLSDPSAKITSDPVGITGKQRGFNTTNDKFVFFGLTLTYSIRSLKCPPPGKT